MARARRELREPAPAQSLEPNPTVHQTGLDLDLDQSKH